MKINPNDLDIASVKYAETISVLNRPMPEVVTHPSDSDIINAFYKGCFDNRRYRDELYLQWQMDANGDNNKYMEYIKKYHINRVAHFISEYLKGKSLDTYPIWVYQEGNLTKILDGKHRVMAAILVRNSTYLPNLQYRNFEIEVSKFKSQTECESEKKKYDDSYRNES